MGQVYLTAELLVLDGSDVLQPVTFKATKPSTNAAIAVSIHFVFIVLFYCSARLSRIWFAYDYTPSVKPRKNCQHGANLVRAYAIEPAPRYGVKPCRLCF